MGARLRLGEQGLNQLLSPRVVANVGGLEVVGIEDEDSWRGAAHQDAQSFGWRITSAYINLFVMEATDSQCSDNIAEGCVHSRFDHRLSEQEDLHTSG